MTDQTQSSDLSDQQNKYLKEEEGSEDGNVPVDGSSGSLYSAPQAFNIGGPYFATPEMGRASTYEMNNSLARESEDSKGYADLTFSDFPSTSQFTDAALSKAGQTFYADFRDLGPAGGSSLQSVRQQPLPNMTCSYSPMLDSMPRNVPALQPPSDPPVTLEEDWISASEDEGPVEQVKSNAASLLPTASQFGHPDSELDECSINPPFPALDSEYIGLAPYQRYRTNIPNVFEESLADATGKAGNCVVPPPTGSHSILVNPSELSGLGEGIASSELRNNSKGRVIPSRPRRGKWESVLPSAIHSKKVYSRGYLDSASLYVIDHDSIEPTMDGLAAFAREYLKSLQDWNDNHLEVQVDKPTQKKDRTKARKAKELCCNQILLDWYKEELQTANERDFKTLQSWKESTISQVFAAKAGTRLADLFSWDRLQEKLTRSWGEDPKRMIDGSSVGGTGTYRVTFSGLPMPRRSG